MPFTPVVSRPMYRTSDSWNRTERPWRVARITSFVPLVIWTSISSSPLSTLMALMPLVRGFEYSLSAVFFTVPSLVQKKRYCSSENSLTGSIALISVSGDTLIRFTIGRPFVARPACGISCHFEFEAAAIIREEEDVIVRRADEQVLDEIRVLQILAREPPPATPLAPVRRGRRCA